MKAIIIEDISHDEQLRRWADGESVHRSNADFEQCCPDFSCCNAELQADEVVRRAFVSANESERIEFLGTFLSAAFSSAAKEKDSDLRVHIAGRTEES